MSGASIAATLEPWTWSLFQPARMAVSAGLFLAMDETGFLKQARLHAAWVGNPDQGASTLGARHRVGARHGMAA